MIDTLYEMAGKQHDVKMQAVALCTKLDYYYYGQDENKTDSIVVWTDRVKQFARATNQPRYYYFAWASRLIRHHIGQGEYNIALLETEKMLREAEAEDYKEGISDCYSCMASIYNTKGLQAKSLEFILKELELFEKYNLDRYNISMVYSSAIRFHLDLGQIDSASLYLNKALEHAKTSYHRFTVTLSLFQYNLAIENIPEAVRLLDECRKIQKEDPSLDKHVEYLYNAELIYFKQQKMYNKALEVSKKIEDILVRKNLSLDLSKLWENKADIFFIMGNYKEATDLYRQYLGEEDKRKLKNEEITTAEFATLLNMQKLTSEKNELAVLSQKRKLQNTNLIILFLAILLIIVSGFMYHQRKLYKKIKKSRDKLNEQNLMLLSAKDELKHARDMAEQSSRMKTVFIQSMSHEIRTPLNSIVGFSAVLADLYADKDDEIHQYTLLIEENSRLLLKMITDILDISALDEMEDQEIEVTPVDIYKTCEKSLEQIKPYVAEGVNINFIHPENKIITNTNESLLLQVLDNLLDNAAKFTKKGEITLTYDLTNDDRELSFIVKDTGLGIPADKRDYIFERFVKLDEFTQGTGLGLSICKMIAEKMGGSLILDENYANGCCFVFSIPTCKSM